MWPTGMLAIELSSRLSGYFSNERIASYPWFQPWMAILSSLGVSYSRDATSDLSPRPTATARTFTKDPEKRLFLRNVAWPS